MFYGTYEREEYCDDCRYFEPVISMDRHVVYCKHRERCARIKEYMEKRNGAGCNMIHTPENGIELGADGLPLLVGDGKKRMKDVVCE